MEWFKKGNVTRHNKEQLSWRQFCQIPTVQITNRTVNLVLEIWKLWITNTKLGNGIGNQY